MTNFRADSRLRTELRVPMLLATLLVALAGCVPAATGSTSDGTSGQLDRAEDRTPYQVVLVRDFPSDPSNAGVHGIASWQVSAVGIADGRAGIVVAGADLDGLTHYTIEVMVADARGPLEAPRMELRAHSLDGTSVEGLLDEQFRAALASDLDLIRAALAGSAEGEPMGEQSLRGQTFGKVEATKACWMPVALTALFGVSTALVGITGFATCTGTSLATLGLSAFACYALVGQSVALTAAATAIAADAFELCMEQQGF